MFNKAIVKLTMIYISILFCIIVIFSLLLYGVTNRNMDKEQFQFNPKFNYETINDENIKMQIDLRDKEIKQGIRTELILLDIVVFMIGSVASYFLSKRTLSPIDKAYQIQEQFVSDASHELRTPLTAIYMENEVMLRDNTATRENLKTLIKSNLEEIKKLQSLVNNLLNIGKNEKMEFTDVNIKELIDDVIRDLRIDAKNKNIVIKNDVHSKIIKADSFALSHIMKIIIENAIKYSEENKQIQVVNGNKTISVIDEGCGIPEKDLPHIFNRFYRADKARSTEGFGLGLSIAQKLAEKMKMKITAKNNEKSGATFTIILN